MAISVPVFGGIVSVYFGTPLVVFLYSVTPTLPLSLGKKSGIRSAIFLAAVLIKLSRSELI